MLESTTPCEWSKILTGLRRISIRQTSGFLFPIGVKPSAMIENVKQAIQDREGYSLQEQRLFLHGQNLENCRLVSQLNEELLHLVLHGEARIGVPPDSCCFLCSTPVDPMACGRQCCCDGCKTAYCVCPHAIGLCSITVCEDCYVACSVCSSTICTHCTMRCIKCGTYNCVQCSRKCSCCTEVCCFDCLENCTFCGSMICEDCVRVCAGNM
jgi:hypothetical protein